MNDGDTGSIFASVATGARGAVTMASLAKDCLALLPAESVSVTLMAGGREEAATASSSSLGTSAQDLEFTFGEGPGTDAFSSGLPVVVADVAATDGRWPLYVRAAEVAGVRAVAAFPLRIGAAKLGLLTLYRSRPHSLTDAERATAAAVAEALAQVLVALQAGAGSETLAAALEAGAAFRSVVHQATGALAAQLGCSLGEALVRLRGAAFAMDRSLPDVAADVVAGRLRIEGS